MYITLCPIVIRDYKGLGLLPMHYRHIHIKPTKKKRKEQRLPISEFGKRKEAILSSVDPGVSLPCLYRGPVLLCTGTVW
jgi:hypothetical protein